MESIRRSSNSGSGGTEDVDFIQCVDSQEPQIHNIWCLSSDGVTRKIHPTMQAEVAAGTVVQFKNNFLAENGCRIPIIGPNFISGSVQLLGIPDFFRNSEF